MKKSKLFPFIFSPIAITSTFAIVSCSDSNYYSFEKELSNGVVEKLSLSDYSEGKYYGDFYSKIILMKPDIFKNFFVSKENEKYDEKIKNFNDQINSEIEKDNNIQKQLKVLMAQSMYFIYKDLYNINAGGQVYSVNNSAIDSNYSQYSNLVEQDDPNEEDVEKYEFLKLDSIIDSINDVKINLLSSGEINGTNLKLWWNFSFTFKEDSSFVRLFEQDKSIFKSQASLVSDQQVIIDKLEAEGATAEEIELATNYFLYKSTGMFYDEKTQIIKSIPFESSPFFKNKEPLRGRILKNDNDYLRPNFFSIDFLQTKKLNQFIPVLKINSSSIFNKSKGSEWNDYMVWAIKNKKINFDKKSNLYIDLGLAPIEFDGFAEDNNNDSSSEDV